MVMQFRRFHLGLAASTALGSILCGVAFAEGADSDSGQLQEIVVTAQKRTEDVTKVPISIFAVDQETMDKQGVKDFTDVARLVPGLNFQTTDDAGDSQISIRGISSDVGDATTGVYIDDTPIQVRPDAVGSNAYPKIFDLDRLEVLRGPQGTLFGAGSEGGTVRFITPEADLHKYSGYAEAEVAYTDGGDPDYEVGAAVGGPIVDGKVGFRASAWYREDGGYIDRVNPATDQTVATNTNSGASTVFHLAFKIAPTDDLVITPSVFFQRVSLDDASIYWESLGPYKEYTGMPQPQSDRFVLPTLGVSYDFGDFSMKSISSYFDRDLTQQYDATNYEVTNILPTGPSVPGYPGYLVQEPTQSGQINFTQEIRFTSNDSGDSPLSWVGGLFYGHYRANYSTTVFDPLWNVLTNDASEDYYGVPSTSLNYWGEALLPGNVTYWDHFVETETDLALFADATYSITPALKIAAGVRGARSGFTYYDQEDGPWGPAEPFQESGSAKEYPITPRFTVSYQLDSNQMVYATAAKGYRIGGANEPVPEVSCGPDLKALGLGNNVPAQYASDSVWSYEGGIKGRFFDNKVLVESSLFWVNWDQIQQEVYLPTCAYYYIGNLGKAASRGVDLQAEWAVDKHLTLSGNFGLTDARYTKSTVQEGQILAESGDPLPTPEWTAVLSAEYTTQIMDSTDGYLRADYSFQGPYFRYGSANTFGYDPLLTKAPASHYVTMRAGAKWGDWDVSLYADNLLDSDTSLLRYRDSLTSYALRDITFRPLTAGLRAEYKF